MNVVSQCYLCQSKNVQLKDTKLRKGEEIPVVRCLDCQVSFLDREHPNYAKEMYVEDDYIKRNPQVFGGEDLFEYNCVREKTYQESALQIRKLLDFKDSILEVGCGCGSLLNLLKGDVKEARGLEINRRLAEFAHTELKLDVTTLNFEEVDFGEEKFKAVFLLHILEHLVDPLLYLNKAKNLLTKDGFIWIELPNTDEALMEFLNPINQQKYQRFNYHLAHLWYFNAKSLALLCEQAGLKCDIRTKHDYNFKNFMQWWFVGEPSVNLKEGQLINGLYSVASNNYMQDCNELMTEMDQKFRNLLDKHMLGSTLVCKAYL